MAVELCQFAKIKSLSISNVYRHSLFVRSLAVTKHPAHLHLTLIYFIALPTLSILPISIMPRLQILFAAFILSRALADSPYYGGFALSLLEGDGQIGICPSGTLTCSNQIFTFCCPDFTFCGPFQAGAYCCPTGTYRRNSFCSHSDAN